MEEGTIEIKSIDNFDLISFKGYFNDESGAKVTEAVESLMKMGRFKILLDLSNCSILSSPGVGIIVDTSMKIQDHRGQFLLMGLDPLKTSILTISGVIPMVPVVGSLKKAKEVFTC